MIGVTFHCAGLGSRRHVSSSCRKSLTIGDGLYSVASLESSSSNERLPCALADFAEAPGNAVHNADDLRDSIIRFVGCPSSSSSQCRPGYSYGELSIGLSKKLIGSLPDCSSRDSMWKNARIREHRNRQFGANWVRYWSMGIRCSPGRGGSDV